MDLLGLLQIMRRWIGVIASTVLVTGLVLGVRLQTLDPIYETFVKVQFTAPQEEDVALFDAYRPASLQEEISIARNNFSGVLQSRDVYDRTIEELGLTDEDTGYLVEVSPVRDSDFMYVGVRARSPELAERTANAHVSIAIAAYGEIRAKPSTAAKHFLDEQMRLAEQSLRSAEQIFTDFKIKNGISTMEIEIDLQRQALANLEEERNRRLIEGPTSRSIRSIENLIDQLLVEREKAVAQGDAALVARIDEAIARNREDLERQYNAGGATEHIDGIIERRREELAGLIQIQSTYGELEQNVTQARANYQLLQSKYTEAALKETTVKAASFIQVVEPALAPSTPVSTKARVLLMLGLLGSLALGTLLALGLDYVSRQTAGKPLLDGRIPSPRSVNRS